MIYLICLAACIISISPTAAFADMAGPPEAFFLAFPVAVLGLIALMMLLAFKFLTVVKNNNEESDAPPSADTPAGTGGESRTVEMRTARLWFIEIKYDVRFIALSKIIFAAAFVIVPILIAVGRDEMHKRRAEKMRYHGKTKAKQDCDTLVQAILKHNSLGGTEVKDRYMAELKEKYISNIDEIKDVWGNRYEHDHARKTVYSKGPDGLHRDEADGGSANIEENKDDIFLFYGKR
ncbi:MAG TPA: hypothetical protein DC017_14795 [Candidatus Wallbacteria bacterium]|nr:hypothetical protein [Candidatus Wallbacteria bacterium]